MLFPSNFETTFGSTISLFFHLWLWATRPYLGGYTPPEQLFVGFLLRRTFTQFSLFE